LFFGFLSIYLCFSFFILPALSAILKIRQRKLAGLNTSTNVELTVDHVTLTKNDTIFSNIFIDIGMITNLINKQIDPKSKHFTFIDTSSKTFATTRSLLSSVLLQTKKVTLFVNKK
jgi:hypothetical protein